jgi:outer membrane protein assembly factor BamB
MIKSHRSLVETRPPRIEPSNHRLDRVNTRSTAAISNSPVFALVATTLLAVCMLVPPALGSSGTARASNTHNKAKHVRNKPSEVPQWKFQAADQSPSRVVAWGNNVYFTDRGKVYALNARNGKTRWVFRLDDRSAPQPAFAHGALVVATRNSIICLRANTGHESRIFTRPNLSPGPPTALGGIDYFASESGTVYAVGARHGDELWSFRSGLKGRGIILAGTTRSHLVYYAPAFKAGLTGQRLESRLKHPILIALSRATGHRRWTLAGHGYRGGRAVTMRTFSAKPAVGRAFSHSPFSDTRAHLSAFFEGASFATKGTNLITVEYYFEPQQSIGLNVSNTLAESGFAGRETLVMAEVNGVTGRARWFRRLHAKTERMAGSSFFNGPLLPILLSYPPGKVIRFRLHSPVLVESGADVWALSSFRLVWHYRAPSSWYFGASDIVDAAAAVHSAYLGFPGGECSFNATSGRIHWCAGDIGGDSNVQCIPIRGPQPVHAGETTRDSCVWRQPSRFEWRPGMADGPAGYTLEGPSGMAISGNQLIETSPYGSTLVLDTASGRLLNTLISASSSVLPVVSGTRVFVTTYQGRILAYKL